MPFRLLRPALAAAALLVAMPTAASAAGAALRAPADGVVTGATALTVHVRTEPTEIVDRIEVSLRRSSGELDGFQRHLLCDDRDVCSRTEADYTLDFDPRTGAPFVAGSRTLPNGAYVLRVHVERPVDPAAATLDLPLTLSAPPSAPADLTAEVDGDEVTLSWRRAPEPDVSGHLVELLADDGWQLIAELPPEATSVTDRPGRGHRAYRVVTLRPDGRGATYETASPELSVAVGATSDGPDVEADEAARADDDTDGVDHGAGSVAGSGGAPAGDRPVARAPRIGGEAPIPALSGTARSEAGTPAPDADDLGPEDAGVPTTTADGDVVFAAPDGSPLAAGSQGAPSGSTPRLLGGALLIALALAAWRWNRQPARR
ncbi:hypothetical protein [Egicoccus sp. AB-alg6-2]|uniref:hypothetical protein n=1 Tax=Egicoccus sp. AB-alg6-2 TaxID=3242692 RepID=UPI00359EF102